MGTIYAGTSGWSYSTWKPRFYPTKLSSAKFLSYYANRLNSVEVNYTFRVLPTEKLLRGWVDATPANFKFAIKAHQGTTHVKRLRNARQATNDFLASLEPLRDSQKLGAVLFQLPPFLKLDLPLLKDFVAGLPSNTRFAIEFRHESWFNEDVYDALRRVNVALCRAESEKLKTPDVDTADFSYLRLRKKKYSPKARTSLRADITNLARRGTVFVYFKHEDDPDGALYAEDLLA